VTGASGLNGLRRRIRPPEGYIGIVISVLKRRLRAPDGSNSKRRSRVSTRTGFHTEPDLLLTFWLRSVGRADTLFQ
jgi:hypothetical protein